MKKMYIVNQGTANKSISNCDMNLIAEFTNKAKAIKLFNEIKHSKGWVSYYCVTTVEIWNIAESDDEEDEYIDTLKEFYEEQK